MTQTGTAPQVEYFELVLLPFLCTLSRGDLLPRGNIMKTLKIAAAALVLASTAAQASHITGGTAPNENASCAAFTASFMPGAITRFAHRRWADDLARDFCG